MNQIASFEFPTGAAPVMELHGADPHGPTEDRAQTAMNFRRTRSTLSFVAADLVDLTYPDVADTITSLLELCAALNRDEIVIENIEDLAKGASSQAIPGCVDFLQGVVYRASRKMMAYPPRIALEKRGHHFDLRIYPHFH